MEETRDPLLDGSDCGCIVSPLHYPEGSLFLAGTREYQGTRVSFQRETAEIMAEFADNGDVYALLISISLYEFRKEALSRE